MEADCAARSRHALDTPAQGHVDPGDRGAGHGGISLRFGRVGTWLDGRRQPQTTRSRAGADYRRGWWLARGLLEIALHPGRRTYCRAILRISFKPTLPQGKSYHYSQNAQG
jgi:hypothetical protein